MAHRPYLVFLFPITVIVVFSLVGRLLKPHPSIRNALGGAAVVIFFLIFGGGFTTAAVLIISQATRKHDWGQMALATPFLVVGAAFSAALLVGGPAMLRENKRKAAHPNEPWMWNADWASGAIPSHNAAAAAGTWIFAVVWNSIAIPSAVLAFSQYRHHPDPKIWVVLLFPAIGLLILILALRATAQAILFGKSTLHLQSIPVPIGGALAGSILLNRPLNATGPIRLHLTCHRLNRSGRNNSNSSDHLVWEDEQQLDRVPASAQGTEIPVYFFLPAGQPQTFSQGSTQVRWQLDVKAPAMPIAYRGSYKLPVFGVSSAPPAPPPPDLAQFVHHDDPKRPPRIPGITVSLLADGGRVIHVAAARNPGASATITLFGLIFTGITVFLAYSTAPIKFPIVFGLFSLVIDLVAINSWLSSSTITIRRGCLTVDRGMPLVRSHRQMPAESIDEIAASISSTTNNVAYYTIAAVVDGKRTRLASGIKGKQNAEHLAHTMWQMLGPKP